MILVVCEADDDDAIWVSTELSRRGQEVTTLLPEEFIVDASISVNVTTDTSNATLETRRGDVVRTESLVGVVNRMTGFPRDVSSRLDDKDLVYRAEEIRAVLVAWFAAAACPVLNPPFPYSAQGFEADDVRWRCLAHTVGLPPLPFASNRPLRPDHPSIRGLVVGDVFLHSSDETRAPRVIGAGLDLACSVASPLLELEFANTEDGLRFVRASTLPHLRRYGLAVIDSLLDCLDMA